MIEPVRIPAVCVPRPRAVQICAWCGCFRHGDMALGATICPTDPTLMVVWHVGWDCRCWHQWRLDDRIRLQSQCPA